MQAQWWFPAENIGLLKLAHPLGGGMGFLDYEGPVKLPELDQVGRGPAGWAGPSSAGAGWTRLAQAGEPGLPAGRDEAVGVL